MKRYTLMIMPKNHIIPVKMVFDTEELCISSEQKILVGKQVFEFIDGKILSLQVFELDSSKKSWCRVCQESTFSAEKFCSECGSRK